MKEILGIVLLFPFSLTAKAQQENLKLPLTADTSVLKIPHPKLTWISNNNHWDIYQATPDNMYVIKPDSTRHFNIPNAVKNKIMIIPIKPSEKNPDIF